MSTQFESFVSVISQSFKEINRIKGREMRNFGLKGTDSMCLYYLAKAPEGMASAELARKIGVDRAAVSRTITRLEEGGYATTDHSQHGTGYRAPIRLTDKGIAAVTEVNQVIDEVVNRAIEGVPAADRAAMYRALDAINANLASIG